MASPGIPIFQTIDTNELVVPTGNRRRPRFVSQVVCGLFLGASMPRASGIAVPEKPTFRFGKTRLRSYQNLIGGSLRRTPASDSLEVLNPSTEEVGFIQITL